MENARNRLREAVLAHSDRARAIGLSAGYALGCLFTAIIAMATTVWLTEYWLSVFLIWIALHLYLFIQTVVSSFNFRRGSAPEHKAYQRLEVEIDNFGLQSQISVLAAVRPRTDLH